MNIAVVILNWNGKSLLEEFVPSVIKFSKEASIYIVDNASTDDSILYIKNTFPDIKIIQNTDNGGYAKGYNDGLKHIESDIYCLLNSDVAVTENWLQPIINAFNESETIAAVQPKILDYKKKTHFEYAGAAGGFIDKLGYPYCRGRVFDTLEEDLGQYNDQLDIFWASGACLFIRKSVFEEFNGFDEDFFAHQEEIDLCWRMHNQGYIIKYIGQSKVYHLGGATLSVMNSRKTFLNFRNNLLMMVKNIRGVKIWHIFFIRMILDGVAGFKYLTTGKPKLCIAILKAHISFYYHLPNFLKKRKKLRSQRKYYSVSSVVWQYYIRNKKLFNQL